MQGSLRTPTSALAGLLLLAILAAAILASLAPPAPQPATADLARFSAERAMRHVESLASQPRPVGSAAHDRARDYLIGELRGLGLEPQVQVVTTHWARRGRTLAARVENVVARLPGTAPGGVVLLMAHYDSRALTPGAGDDASGTAALLETARTLRQVQRPENDLVFLFTDGEELALLGAKAFAEEHPWAKEVEVVFNFEARGNRGRALMFEAGPGNLREARNLLAAPDPVASSLSSEVYRRMPNDTDFTVFRERGIPGLNFAFIGGHPAYHSMLDTPQRLSRGSLQQLGDYAVAMATRYGTIDLSQRTLKDAVYFNPFGSWLVVYPAGWVMPLTVAAALATLAALVLARQRGLATWTGVAGASGLLLGLVAAAGLLGFAFWWLLEALAGGHLRTPHELPYPSSALTIALGLGVLALVSRAAIAWRRVIGAFDLGAALALLWATLALVVSAEVAGASYLLTWPALAASGTLLAAALGARAAGLAVGQGVVRAQAADCGLWAVSAAVPLLLWLPTAQQVSEALSLRLAPAVAVVTLLALVPLLPLLRSWQDGAEPPTREPFAAPRHLGALLASLGLVLAIGCLALAGPSAERPRVDSLVYLVEPEKVRASWLSFDPEPDDWTRHALGGEPESAEASFPSLRGVRWGADAPVLELSAPELTVISERRDGRDEWRQVDVRLRSLRGAPILRLDATATVPLHLVGVEGRPVETGGNGAEVYFAAFAVPAEGITVTLEVAGRWPIEATLSDQSYGLPAALDQPARPADRISDPRWQAESTWVARKALF
jgi:hypothetical protein